jgi:hypothetical protein
MSLFFFDVLVFDIPVFSQIKKETGNIVPLVDSLRKEVVIERERKREKSESERNK